MKETMKEMKKECYILTSIKRRKRKRKMNCNIDICRIDSIRRVSKDAGLTIKFGISTFTERFIYLLNNPEGDYSKERLKKLQDQLSLLVLLKKSESPWKEQHYLRIKKILDIIFLKEGIPNFKTFMGCSEVRQTPSEEFLKDIVLNYVKNKKKLKWEWMRHCGIYLFEGVGSSTILNIGYFLLKGVLPDLEHLESETKEKVDYKTLINSLQESIQQLTLENRKIESTMHQEDICSICMSGENLVPNEKCGHKFHTECLVKWLEHKNCCPVCRTRLVN